MTTYYRTQQHLLRQSRNRHFLSPQYNIKVASNRTRQAIRPSYFPISPDLLLPAAVSAYRYKESLQSAKELNSK